MKCSFLRFEGSYATGTDVLARDTDGLWYVGTVVGSQNGYYEIRFRRSAQRLSRNVRVPAGDIRPASLVADLDTSERPKPGNKSDKKRVNSRGVKFYDDELDTFTPTNIEQLNNAGVFAVRKCPICEQYYRDFVEHWRRHGRALEDRFRDWTVPDPPASFKRPRQDMFQPTPRQTVKSTPKKEKKVRFWLNKNLRPYMEKYRAGIRKRRTERGAESPLYSTRENSEIERERRQRNRDLLKECGMYVDHPVDWVANPEGTVITTKERDEHYDAMTELDQEEEARREKDWKYKEEDDPERQAEIAYDYDYDFDHDLDPEILQEFLPLDDEDQPEKQRKKNQKRN